MQINIKKLHQNAVIPTYAKPGDAGMDLTATSKSYDEHGNVVYGTGLAFEIPEGYVGLLFPRSSNTKKDLLLGNSVGVLDSGYRGEVVFKFKPSVVYADYTTKGEELYSLTSDLIDIPTLDGGDIPHEQYEVGDRIGQIIVMPYPQVNFIEVDTLQESERGEGGFGSSGQ